MKKSRKITVFISIILCVSFLFNITAVAQQELNVDNATDSTYNENRNIFTVISDVLYDCFHTDTQPEATGDKVKVRFSEMNLISLSLISKIFF